MLQSIPIYNTFISELEACCFIPRRKLWRIRMSIPACCLAKGRMRNQASSQRTDSSGIFRKISRETLSSFCRMETQYSLKTFSTILIFVTKETDSNRWKFYFKYCTNHSLQPTSEPQFEKQWCDYYHAKSARKGENNVARVNISRSSVNPPINMNCCASGRKLVRKPANKDHEWEIRCWKKRRNWWRVPMDRKS
jgi:hypothetical protein